MKVPTYLRKKQLAISPTCETCGSEQQLEVHHIQPNTRNPDSLSNFSTLCHRCHLAITKAEFGHMDTDYYRYANRALQIGRIDLFDILQHTKAEMEKLYYVKSNIPYKSYIGSTRRREWYEELLQLEKHGHSITFKSWMMACHVLNKIYYPELRNRKGADFNFIREAILNNNIVLYQ